MQRRSPYQAATACKGCTTRANRRDSTSCWPARPVPVIVTRCIRPTRQAHIRAHIFLRLVKRLGDP